MEKLKTSKIKFYLMSFILFLILYLIFLFEELNIDEINIIFVSLIITATIVIVTRLTNNYKQDGTYFSENGITMIFESRKYFIQWADLNITKKVDLRYIMKFNLISNQHKVKFSLLIFWPTEDDILKKTKKYCPKDNELYNLVEGYAKKRNIPF